MKRKIIAYLLPVVVITAIVMAVTSKKEAVYHHNSGFIFGTSYNITYKYHDDIKEEIERTLNAVDASLSPFNGKSTITAVNQNRDTILDPYFLEVFSMAKEIHKDTKGAFDITVAPLVNAWGFGFKSGKMPTKRDIDSLMTFVGFEKASLDNSKVVKKDQRVMLDCSAIAKGYGVDQVAKLLEGKGIADFMVEIGGEIVARGANANDKSWHIGVTKPTDDSLSTNNDLQTVLSITDIAMATSGNYRNFYYKGGKKYAHTIDPKTGFPVQHNILSATVLAENCAKADAYATAFMVLGLDKTIEILKRHKEMMAYLIYNKEGEYAVWMSDGMKERIAK